MTTTTKKPKRNAIVEIKGERCVAEILDTDWCVFLGEEVAWVRYAINAAPIWARVIKEL